MIRNVLLLGNPLLREKSANVVDFDSELIPIVRDLEDTLSYLQESTGIGRALAAPQIGHMKKVILYNTPDARLVMVNPVINHRSEEMFDVWDSCFSFDVAFFVNIKRHLSIEVSYFNEQGDLKSATFNDDLSELFQHEIDHLYGILATDYLTDNKQILMRSEWEKI